jgi:hypothetical protein
VVLEIEINERERERRGGERRGGVRGEGRERGGEDIGGGHHRSGGENRIDDIDTVLRCCEMKGCHAIL